MSDSNEPPTNDTARSEDPASAEVPPAASGRRGRRARIIIAVGLALVLVAGAVSAWIWLVRPRQMVEVHDDTGRITVRVPRAWTKQVEGRVPQDRWQAYLFFGEFETTPLKIMVYDGLGHLDVPLGKQCDIAAEDLADNSPTSENRLWAYRNCPEDKVTLLMEKTVERRIVFIAEVRADDEKLARQVLNSIDVKLP